MTYGKGEQEQKQQDSDSDEYSSLVDNDSPSKQQPQLSKQQQQASDMKAFLIKVFQNDEVRSLADARLKIEEEFEHNFMPDRDLLDYNKQKQESNRIRGFHSPIKPSKVSKQLSSNENMQEERQHLQMHRSSSQISRHSNLSMKEEDHQSNTDQQIMMDIDQSNSVMSEDRECESSLNDSQSNYQKHIPYKTTSKASKIQQEETKEEDDIPQPKPFLERCKEVGRLGPLITTLDKEAGSGQIKHFGTDFLEVEAISQFASIKANTAVFAGRYYYEVKLLTSGLMQVGWCTLATPFMMDNGVGDDETSYAYDGYRILKWNMQQQPYGEAWSAGDIIGTMIDFDRREIKFWRNDKCLDVAFKNIKVGPNMAYFPAISLQQGERVLFNFGRKPFKVRSNYSCLAINEPDCQINNYYSTAMYVQEIIKRYVVTYYEFEQVNVDARLMVGSILFEYLLPLMADPYVMEDIVVQFFFELAMIPKPEFLDLILKTLEIHCSYEQLIDWTSSFMSILCKKINEIQIAKCEKETNKEFDLNYMKVLVEILKGDTFMYAWLSSESFNEDLENLYMLHLPSSTDWDLLVPYIYHELSPGTEPHKEHYQQSVKHILQNLKTTQKYWLQVTDQLMDSRKRYFGENAFPKAPRELFLEFIHYLVFKNSGYTKNVKPPGLTPVTTLANVFFCTVRHLDDIVFSQPIEKFPFQCFFMRDQTSMADENIKQLERIGGTLSHLENELAEELQQFKGKQLTQKEKESYMLAKNLTLIFNFGILQEVSQYVKCLEKLYVNNRLLEDLTPKGRDEVSQIYLKEIQTTIKKLLQYHLIFQSDSNRVQIHKYALWMMRLINHIDENYDGVVYIMPECFVEIPFEIFRGFKRGGITLYETQQEQDTYKDEYEEVYSTPQLKQTSFAFELVRYISKHFYDPKIANPDLKELYLTRLNILLQYDQYIKIFENYEYAQKNLIPLLMQSFEKRFIFPVTKNFLRFAKGRGFKEIVYQKLVENTHSEYFLKNLREHLLSNSKPSNDFMNALFNNLNDVTTELFVTFKELKNNYQHLILKRTKTYFQMVVDLCRVLEIITLWVPEIFVDKELIHSSRLLNYIMFILNSVFIGSIDQFIEFFATKIQQRSDSLPQFLSPLVSILRNIYLATNELGTQNNQRFDDLAEIFQKTDSYDSILFERLIKTVKNELPPTNADEKKIFDDFETMLYEIEMLCQCNKIRKHSLKSQDSGDGNIVSQLMQEAEDLENDENLCNICYFNEKNTIFEPCGHITCQKCIQVHMLNSERCPFCNVVITETKKMAQQ